MCSLAFLIINNRSVWWKSCIIKVCWWNISFLISKEWEKEKIWLLFHLNSNCVLCYQELVASNPEPRNWRANIISILGKNNRNVVSTVTEIYAFISNLYPLSLFLPCQGRFTVKSRNKYILNLKSFNFQTFDLQSVVEMYF